MNKAGNITTSVSQQEQAISKYYRRQSRIYDATRWSFLFGRRRILRFLPFAPSDSFSLLEVGCGTGYNLANLAQAFPHAQLTGMDLSADMLNIAGSRCATFGNRVQLKAMPYGAADSSEQYDAILFSYALTMINPQWEALLQQARKDLRPGGCIAVVDFHDSRAPWFKSHMSNHHVRMDSHLLPVLEKGFEPLHQEVRAAYGGVWAYMLYVGQVPKV